jgi:thiamine pyrophosphokinase
VDHAIVLADGDAPTLEALDATWAGWRDGVGFVIAADGGARLASELRLPLDRWVGDGDSLEPEQLEQLRSAGVPIDLVASAKDESDTELALLAAVKAGATRITILGALGGQRFDHALANVALLAHPALRGVDARIVGERSRIRLLTGPATAERRGRVGDIVSLLPFGGDVGGVTTHGLRYALRDGTLAAGPARGLSNERTVDDARVEVRSGRLLVVETPATLSR